MPDSRCFLFFSLSFLYRVGAVLARNNVDPAGVIFDPRKSAAPREREKPLSLYSFLPSSPSSSRLSTFPPLSLQHSPTLKTESHYRIPATSTKHQRVQN